MVNTREIAEEYRLSYWAQVMRERQESGQSIKAYCREIGMSANTYYYWQRKLRASVCEALAAGESETSEELAVPRGWAVCQPALAEPTPIQAIIIEIGKGRITATVDTDSALLLKVCRVLSEL
jgi:transposase-like protein